MTRVSSTVLDCDEALELLDSHAVPAAPAIRQEDIPHDRFLQQEHLLDAYEHPDHGPVRGVRGYGRWGNHRSGFSRRAPLLGEHTVEILEEFGIDEGRRMRLLEEAVVRQAS